MRYYIWFLYYLVISVHPGILIKLKNLYKLIKRADAIQLFSDTP